MSLLLLSPPQTIVHLQRCLERVRTERRRREEKCAAAEANALAKEQEQGGEQQEERMISGKEVGGEYFGEGYERKRGRERGLGRWQSDENARASANRG